MRIEIISLCDAATTDFSGKLNILGAFDTIWTSSVPITHPQCAIALRVRFENIERGEHKIVVNLVNLDGKHIIQPANGVINVNFPDKQSSGSANLILNIQMLRLEGYGDYSIDLAIDGRREASLPLLVKERKA
jgi:hypothetical protein